MLQKNVAPQLISSKVEDSPVIGSVMAGKQLLNAVTVANDLLSDLLSKTNFTQ